MRNILIIILIWCMGSTQGVAQKQFVNKGVSAYHQQDYAKAVRNFNLAIENRSKLKQEDLFTTYYLRGKCFVELFRQTKPVEENTIRPEKYSNFIFEAYSDFERASNNTDELGYKKMNLDFDALYDLLLESGSIALKNSDNEDFSDQEQERQLDFSLKCFNKAILIDNTDYVSYDLLGQAALKKNLFPEALENFYNAGKLYQINPPDIPDFNIAYVYYKMGDLHRYKLNGKDIIGMEGYENEVDIVFELLEEGKNVLKKEYERLEKDRSTLDPEKVKRLEVQFGHAMEDLNTFELDIYLNDPKRKKEAVKKLKEAIQAEPENYLVYIAYAQLIANEDENEAIRVYKKAIKIDSEKEFAHFNLGRIYVDRAEVWSAAANDEMDLNKSREKSKKAKENLELAKPCFEQTLQLDPNDLSAVEALIQVSIGLELYDDYKKYLELKQKIQEEK